MTGKSIRILTVTLAFLGVLFLLQPAALADPVTMELTGAPSGNLGGVYTSPYQISVNGSSEELLVCDDFETDINFGYEWTANEYTLANVTNSGPQKFPMPAGGDITVYLPGQTSGTAYTAQQAYYAAAVLVDALLTGTETQGSPEDYSYAIWQIFDPNAYKGYDGNSLGSADLQSVTNAMTGALAQAAPKNGSPAPLGFTLDIYTPCGGSAGCGTLGQNNSSGTGVSQEFLGISVPEGSSTLAILTLDLLTLFGGIFFIRRRSLRKSGAQN